MEDLLPYYERELAFLRRHSNEFAERYPKIAGQLLLHGDGCDDPHVERMIESFALLNARISKKLEDSYPQFTEAMLNVLYPHYLRPFPSCSIAHFDLSGAAASISKSVVLPRGTELKSRAVNGVHCRFRTAWTTRLRPISVTQVRFNPIAEPKGGVSLPLGCTSMLSVRLRKIADQAKWREPDSAGLRFFLDAEPSTAAALRDALFQRLSGIYFSHGEAAWEATAEATVGEVGFRDDESLIDFPDNSHDAYRHLTEYFAFPEKYNFFDLDLNGAPTRWESADELTVHFAFDGLRADSDASRLLQSLSAQNLRLGCVPVVNLFPQRGDPIRITERTATYPVVPDARKAHAYDIYAIDKVSRVRQTANGEKVASFRPFFSLHHGETPNKDGKYWYAQRNEAVAAKSPGYETEITLVDADFEALKEKSDVLSLELTCTNRDLPNRLATGLPGGDLTMDGGTVTTRISLLRKPTKPYRFDHVRDGQWRLISHLSLNHLSICSGGLHVFREMLALYDLPRTAVSRRQIDGITDITQRDKTVWLPGSPFASFVRGLEVTLSVDEENFVGTGLDVFARVVDRFMGLYVHLNSFIELVLVSTRTGEELIRCAPRSGESILA